MSDRRFWALAGLAVMSASVVGLVATSQHEAAVSRGTVTINCESGKRVIDRRPGRRVVDCRTAEAPASYRTCVNAAGSPGDAGFAPEVCEPLMPGYVEPPVVKLLPNGCLERVGTGAGRYCRVGSP